MFNTMMRWAADEGWNQNELAVKLGVSPQNITNWKTRGVPSDRHADIAGLFGRSVDQLLGKTSEPIGPRWRWPYPSVDEKKFRALKEADALRLEAAILLGAAQLGLDVKKNQGK